jgi:hypothetical protein
MPHPCVPPFDTPKLVISKRNRPLETEKRRKKKGGPCHYSPFCLSPRLLYPRTALIGTCVGKGGGGGATFPKNSWTQLAVVLPQRFQRPLGLKLLKLARISVTVVMIILFLYSVFASRFPHAPFANLLSSIIEMKLVQYAGQPFPLME